MTDDEVRCFQLIDNYVHTKHGCFLAEFFRKGSDDASYLCCFRTVGDVADLPGYRFDVGEMLSIVSDKLPLRVMQLLDDELADSLRAKS